MLQNVPIFLYDCNSKTSAYGTFYLSNKIILEMYRFIEFDLEFLYFQIVSPMGAIALQV